MDPRNVQVSTHVDGVGKRGKGKGGESSKGENMGDHQREVGRS